MWSSVRNKTTRELRSMFSESSSANEEKHQVEFIEQFFNDSIINLSHYKEK
jgi:truncated hemoglobin YjbI